MSLSFEWGYAKAVSNLAKHAVSFEEASTVFSDRLSATIHDPLHSTEIEDRFITVGLSNRNRLLVVVHCDRDLSIRVISARQATRRERSVYEHAKEG
jgi:uncharacterized DUF497 family protein